jgi:hypothetical protein
LLPISLIASCSIDFETTCFNQFINIIPLYLSLLLSTQSTLFPSLSLFWPKPFENCLLVSIDIHATFYSSDPRFPSLSRPKATILGNTLDINVYPACFLSTVSDPPAPRHDRPDKHCLMVLVPALWNWCLSAWDFNQSRYWLAIGSGRKTWYDYELVANLRNSTNQQSSWFATIHSIIHNTVAVLPTTVSAEWPALYRPSQRPSSIYNNTHTYRHNDELLLCSLCL